MKLSLFSFLILLNFTLLAQQAVELNVPIQKAVPERINANWVTHPDIKGGEPALVHFRKEITVNDADEPFLINISADNHYKLFVNGKWILEGPQLSDIRNWKYETIDLSPFFLFGKNTVAVEVYNWGYLKFFGKQSVHIALIVNGLTENAQVLNTGNGNDGWKTFLNEGYAINEVKWRSNPKTIIGGLYANNPTDILDFASYPWGWEKADFDDSSWEENKFIESATTAGGSFAWMLSPRNVPLMQITEERLGAVSRSTLPINNDFLIGDKPIEIPPNTAATILLDNRIITMGYPEVKFNGGKGAELKISYAENLFLPDGSKGNRNDIEGKAMVGYHDILLPDGGVGRSYIPTWARTFRYVQFDVKTKDEPLLINDFINHERLSTIRPTAEFHCDDPVYEKIAEICYRTTDVCTQDYFLSDAYYETMQYVGDTKIQALVWQAMTGNDLHTKNALQQFHNSRLPDGNLLGAYPLKTTFVFPTYSIIWVDMLEDYLKYSGDTAFVAQFADGIHHTINGFDNYVKPNGLVAKPPYNYFVDWYVDMDKNNFGMAPRGKGGDNSAVVTLHYVHALQSAAKLCETWGDTYHKQKYLDRANELKAAVRQQCFDAKRGIYATRPDMDYYDMHTNIMAVLTDAESAKKHKELLRKILTDSTISPATYYYRYYLFEAIQKAGATDLFETAQYPWEEMIDNGMTTTLERLESGVKPTRSEAHPWSASPLLFYYTFIAGINQKGHGFKEIEINPNLGKLNHVSGKYPTPEGVIEFDMKRVGVNNIKASITTPKGMSGTFQWKGKTTSLKGGQQIIEL